MRFEPNLNCRRKAEEFKSASLESAQMTLTGNSHICILYICVWQNLRLDVYPYLHSVCPVSIRLDMTSLFFFSSANQIFFVK